MAYYIVRAQPHQNKMPQLRQKLDGGEVVVMRPFGTALDYSLREARIEADGTAIWEEEDYCRPPLAQERAAVLDTYFTNISVEQVERGDGWQKIEALPRLWDSLK